MSHLPPCRPGSRPSSSEAKRVSLPDRLRGDLIGGNADANLRAFALQRLRAGQPAPGGARVIAAAVAVRAARVLREAAEDEQLAFVRLERLEDVGQIEIRAVRRRASSRACARHSARRGTPCASAAFSRRPRRRARAPGIMASSIGSAMAAPRPRRKVRRGRTMDWLIECGLDGARSREVAVLRCERQCLGDFGAALEERIAGHDAGDERGKAVLALGAVRATTSSTAHLS